MNLIIAIVLVMFGASSVMGAPYQMRTAHLMGSELVFADSDDFAEALRVGFFRVKTPPDLTLGATRALGRAFPSMEEYRRFPMLDMVNGYLIAEKAQGFRFCLERDHWPLIFPAAVQQEAEQMAAIGRTILHAILRKFAVPEAVWFEATAGASHGFGSTFLAFNYYDPQVTDRPVGLGAHTDYGYITVLDTLDPGLEAFIDGGWHMLEVDDGYLIINFGEPLQKLIPQVNASLHRVALQTKKLRTSTTVFIDPRVGPYAPEVGRPSEVGMVWDWDGEQKKLVNGIAATDYFTAKDYAFAGKITTLPESAGDRH